MGLRLDGRNPLSYMGVRPQQVPPMVIKKERPTAQDVFNFDIGTFWLIPKQSTSPSEELWVLMGNAKSVATWFHVGASTGELDVRKLEGNSGGVVLPDSNNLINIVGGDGIEVVGNPTTNTLTISPTAIGGNLVKKLTVQLTAADIKALAVDNNFSVTANFDSNQWIAVISTSAWFVAGSTAFGPSLINLGGYYYDPSLGAGSVAYSTFGDSYGISSATDFATTFYVPFSSNPPIVPTNTMSIVINTNPLGTAITGNPTDDATFYYSITYIDLYNN